MQDVGTAAVYHPRKPQASPLWQLLNDHYFDFELNYDEQRVRKYAYPRKLVSCMVYAYRKGVVDLLVTNSGVFASAADSGLTLIEISPASSLEELQKAIGGEFSVQL